MIFTFRYHQESIVVLVENMTSVAILISCTKHILFSNQSKIHMRANRAFPQ